MRSKSRAKSCTRCRQAKLACDARKASSGICSRCRAKGYDCCFDENFQRVSTRRLAQEISHELHASRSTNKISHTKSSAPSPVCTSNENKATISDVGRLRTIHERESNLSSDDSSWLGTTYGDTVFSYQLDSLTLEASTAIELFQKFHLHYYPHATFLRPISSLSELLNISPLLFWTIILISSRGFSSDASLHHEVVIQHKELLSPIMHTVIQQVETIHALLLLCLWPVPQPHYLQNPSWNYAGLAIHAAMQLHFHCPLETTGDHPQWLGLGLAAKNGVNAVDQARTWLGCFQVGTAVATFSGLPSPFSTQQHKQFVDKALSVISELKPTPMTIVIRILGVANSAIDTLSNSHDNSSHFSLKVDRFSRQLDEIKQVHFGSWSSELEVEWCNAKLYIFAMIFTISDKADAYQSREVWIHRQEILLTSFQVATKLIMEFKTFGHLGLQQECTIKPLISVPELYFTSIFNATTFIFRFMATFMTPSASQATQAIDAIREVHKIFHSYSDHREFTRAAIHIETFIDILRNGTPTGVTNLAVKNKLGASVMFDAIFRACCYRNIDRKTLRPLEVQQWSTVNETFAQRLPKIPEHETENLNNNLDLGNNCDGIIAGYPVDDAQNLQWWAEWDNYISFSRLRETSMDVSIWD